ncbi:uncharacterized protein LOC131901328 [Peromyscus eremicus]|uniref:uncharacterized protein LOC131901328 n=1 Tax=Peromyscus eremicus TaxID=42410 RepID=UPI0027DCC36B|nr:uncharacterized protein LOC131901328 [Peromyscus eremicus]
MLRRPRRALCSSRLALPPARSGYFRRWLRLLPAPAGTPRPEPGSEASRLFSAVDRGVCRRRRRRRRRRRLPSKSPNARILQAAQVSLKPSQPLASSEGSPHPSLALSKQSVSSNNPNRPDLRLFPKVSSARSRPLKRLSPILIFGSFRRLHGVTPPLPETFVPFRHRFGKASSTRENFGFFRRCFGSFRLPEPKREGVQMRGGSGSYRRGAGSHSRRLALSVRRTEERPTSRKAREGVRDNSSQWGQRVLEASAEGFFKRGLGRLRKTIKEAARGVSAPA